MMPQTVSLESIPLDTCRSLSSKDMASGVQTNQMARSASTESATLEPGAQSARNVMMVAAKSVASQGVAQARTSLTEVQRYTQQNPDSVRALSFSIALALLIFSVLGVINVFDAVFKPYQYLFALYNVLFAVVIIVADGNPDWFTKYWDAQGKLFGAAAFLATQTGRAAFYFYVGSINLFMLPDNWLWKVIYVGLGGALCFNGALMLLDSVGCCCSSKRQNMGELLFSEA